MRRCRSLSHNNSLHLQEIGPLHAVAVLKSCVREKRLPLAPREQWRVLTDTFGVTDLAEEPPAISQPKCYLGKG